MTAYAYGYNVTSGISYQSAMSIEKKQTNTYHVDVGDFYNVELEK